MTTAILETPPATHDEWLRARKRGIGGSEVAAVLGLSEYSTPWEVWAEKVGKRTVEETDAMRRGKLMEPVVRAEYEWHNEREVEHGKHLFTRKGCLVASPDSIDGDTVVEFKTSNYFAFKRWNDEPPKDYWFQVQHYMYLLDKPTAVIAVLVGGADYHQFPIARSDEYATIHVPLLEAWWNKHMVDGEEPERTDPNEPPPVIVGKAIEATALVRDLVAEIKSVSELQGSITERKETLTGELKSFIGENEQILSDGEPVATYKAQTRRTIDGERLRADNPALADEYTKTTTFRTLRIQ